MRKPWIRRCTSCNSYTPDLSVKISRSTGRALGGYIFIGSTDATFTSFRRNPSVEGAQRARGLGWVPKAEVVETLLYIRMPPMLGSSTPLEHHYLQRMRPRRPYPSPALLRLAKIQQPPCGPRLPRSPRAAKKK